MTHGRPFLIIIAVMAAFFCAPLFESAAEAARLGGGRSFGSRPSYQRSAPAPSPTVQSPGTSAFNSTNSQRPGLQTPGAPGRWGGMLGGMLMGGLIGSMLFGGTTGHAGPGLMDLLVLGGGLFLLFRFLKARRMAAASASPAGNVGFLRTLNPSGLSDSGSPLPSAAAAGSAEIPTLPPGFDQVEFLEGAKTIYTRLQSAWDSRNLEDIRQFTVPDVFAEIQRQAEEDPRSGRTEILFVNARLLEVRPMEGRLVASVLYDVMMREKSEELAKQVRELWHFSREESSPGSHWVLEGLQQLES